MTIAELSVTKKKYYNIVKRCHGYKAFFFVTDTSTKIYSVYRCLSQNCQCQKSIITLLLGVMVIKLFFFVTNAAAKSYSVHR